MKSTVKQKSMVALLVLGSLFVGVVPVRGSDFSASLLLTRPEGPAEDSWLGALADQYLRMRIALDDKLDVIDQRTIVKAVKGYGDYSQPVSKGDYTYALSKQDFSHVVYQNFAVSEDRSRVQLYIELDNFEKNEIVGEFDTEFPMHRLPTMLDSASLWLSKALNGNSIAIKKYIHIPLIPSDVIPSDFEAMGQMIIQSLGTDNSAAWSKAGNTFYTVARRNAKLFMPNFLAGYYLSLAGSHKNAADALGKAIRLIPAFKQIYPLACKSFFASEKYNEVIELVKESEKYGPVGSRMQSFEAQALERLGKTEKAFNLYESVLQHDENNREALIFFAHYYDSTDQLEKAASYAQRALQFDAENGDAWFIVARALVAKGKKEQAITPLKKAASLLENTHLPSHMLGDMYLEKKLYETAAQYLSTALTKAPGNLEIAFKASGAYEAMDDDQKAYAVLSPLAAKNPNNAELHLKLGLFAFERKDTSSSFDHLKRYAALEEKDGEALKILGDLYSRYGNQSKAQYYYAKALPLLDSPYPIMFSMAQFHLKNDKADSAIHLLSRIEEKQATFSGLSRALGDAWYIKNNQQKALAYYRKARDDGDGEKIVQERIAQLSFAANTKDAVKEYRRLTEMDAGNGQVWLKYALLLLEEKKVDEATRHIKKALSLITPDKNTLRRIAHGFEKAQAPGEAAEYYRKAIVLDSGNDTLLLKLASCQLESGQDSAAAQTYVSLYQRRGNDAYKDYLKKAGHLFFELKSYEKAYETYLLFVRSNYSDNTVLLNLAEIEFERKKYKKSAELLEKTTASSRRGEKYSRMLAVSYYETKEYGKCLTAVTGALSRKPRDEELLQMKARSHVAEKQHDQAVITFKTLIRKYGSKEKRKEYAYELGQVYEMAGNPKNASYWYKKGIDSYGGGLRHYLRLGQIYSDRKQLDAALDIYEKAISLADAPDSLVRKVAQAYTAKKEYAAAAKYYRQYLEKAPDDSIAYMELGSLYIEKEEYPRAIGPLKEAIRLMPSNSDVFLLIGGVHRHIGEAFNKPQDVKEAVAYLSRAHELDPTRIEIMDEYAKALRLQGNNGQLIILLQNWHAVEPKNEVVLLELGELFRAGKQTEQAAESWEKACKLDPKNIKLRLKLAEAYQITQNKTAQVAHLQAALEYDQKNPDIHVALARYYVIEKQIEKAKGHYSRAITLKSDFARARFEYASILNESGKPIEAFKQLRTAVKKEGENSEYLFALSKTAFEVEKETVALEAARKAASLNTKDAGVLGWTGYLLFRAGELDSAQAFLATALKADNRCVPCYRYLGDIAYAESRYSDAVSIYQDAMKIGGYNDTVSVMLGNSHLLNGNVKQARKEYHNTYKNNPSHGEALFGLVRSYLRMEKARKALAELKEFRGDKKRAGYYQLSSAYLFENAGNMDSALVAYTLATRLLPTNAEGYAGCGRVMMKLGKYNSAIVYFGKAMAHEPNNYSILLDLGLAYEALKQYSSAMSVYGEALEKDKSNVNTYYYMGRLQSKRRKFSQAIKTIQAGLEVDRNNPKLYYALGNALRMSNRSKDAVKAYEMSIKKGNDKEYLEAYRQIGLLYYHKLVDINNAGKYFKRYLKKGGNEKDVMELLQEMEKKN